MSERETKKLLNRIEALEKQNAKLKKELSKQKKYVSKAADMIMDNYEKCQIEDVPETAVKTHTCENCGKGEVKVTKILTFTFEICPVCQFRKKVK